MCRLDGFQNSIYQIIIMTDSYFIRYWIKKRVSRLIILKQKAYHYEVGEQFSGNYCNEWIRIKWHLLFIMHLFLIKKQGLN